MAGEQHHVAIVGGGFAGLYAVRSLRKAPVRVNVVDRRNFHLFQPLLYEVATAALSPGEIAAPLRAVLKGQGNAEVRMAEVTGFDVANRRVLLADGEIAYDTLILATGGRHSYFGNDDWAQHAPGLKTVEDALGIRQRVLSGFEAAEQTPDVETRRALLTFVVVGGGPTGVELAGALAEISRYTLRGEYSNYDPAEAQVILLEGKDRILPSYAPELSRKAQSALERLGVQVRTGAQVTGISPEGVALRTGGEEAFIPARTALWAAGVQASPLGRLLAEQAGASLDRIGRVVVEPDLTLPGHPEIFVIGDLAHFAHQGGAPLPGVAPVAMQQGDYAAKAIRRRLEGKSMPPFHYRDKGSMAVIGRNSAVAQVGPLKLSGLPAWLAWLFIHLLYIVEFQSRVLIAIRWGWRYFTGNRGARIITAPPDLPPTSPP
jgi:NADH dehydrogenase